ncbi:MAG TPA: hypothetical protein VGB67_01600 [Fibrella sp.]|jgi:hypothetical protein
METEEAATKQRLTADFKFAYRRLSPQARKVAKVDFSNHFRFAVSTSNHKIDGSYRVSEEEVVWMQHYVEKKLAPKDEPGAD